MPAAGDTHCALRIAPERLVALAEAELGRRRPALTAPGPSRANIGAMQPMNDEPEADSAASVHDDRLWRDNGWTARVVKNEDDEGWAVEMVKDGEPEPALVGPWTMGRDKKNPKPLDSAAFNTLVKTAAEVIRRHEQQTHAERHREVTVTASDGPRHRQARHHARRGRPLRRAERVRRRGDELARVRVGAGFRLSAASASSWIENDFRKPS